MFARQQQNRLNSPFYLTEFHPNRDFRGILHGKWIDATQDVDDIQEEIATMLKNSSIHDAEEHAIHDYEGFSGYSVNEYDGIETVQAIATFTEEHGDIGGLLLEHWSGDLEQVERSLDDNYCGQYESLADYAEELTEETTEIPESLRFYIDYAAMARDMELNGDVFTLQTGHEEVHVFWNLMVPDSRCPFNDELHRQRRIFGFYFL